MKTTTKTKKKRTRTGSKLLLAAALLGCVVSPVPGKEKKTQPQETWAVIAGTVFRTPGFALSGAEVTLEPDRAGAARIKAKSQKAVSNSRGEYAFRVPAQPLRYTVSVRAKGFRAEERQVQVEGEQRFDVYFELQPEGGKP